MSLILCRHKNSSTRSMHLQASSSWQKPRCMRLSWHCSVLGLLKTHMQRPMKTARLLVQIFCRCQALTDTRVYQIALKGVPKKVYKLEEKSTNPPTGLIQILQTLELQTRTRSLPPCLKCLLGERLWNAASRKAPAVVLPAPPGRRTMA